MGKTTAYYHLPGLFEFHSFYALFLPLFRTHREYFHPWCEIGSIYGAPKNALWGGDRVGFGEDKAEEVLDLLSTHRIPGRLTFSNSLLREEHLSDRQCNRLCRLFSEESSVRNGVIIHSDLLKEYLRENYPRLYLVSSTTKVLTAFDDLRKELEDEAFRFVVPDFRLNKDFDNLGTLPQVLKDKTEFLVNECCSFSCRERKACYEAVSRMSLGATPSHTCPNTDGHGYRFSEAMENPGFIGVEDIRDIYLPLGFSHFKIEGRSLGSALLLEFILHYMTKPECQLKVREELYLESSLDLF